MKKKVIILGSTGSIGSTTIKIINRDKNSFKVILLTANKNYKKLFLQAKKTNCKNIIIYDEKNYLLSLKINKNKNLKIFNTTDDFTKTLKEKVDYTMCSITGIAGLKPTLEAIKFSRNIAIANKEAIICGWNFIKKDIKKYKTKFIPIDSEHFSIWSLIENTKYKNFEKIYLTASGGPFRKLPLDKFKKITPDKALKHPNWSMGKKISIDSATMMNKVLEVIEAKKIFDLKYNQLEILIHPQSYLHAIVKFDNGLTKLLMHDTKMEIPIFNSLYHEENYKIKSKHLNFEILNNLGLKKLEVKRYPSIKILNNLTNRDSLFETVIVSANDMLVNLFLKNKITFNEISTILLKVIKMKEFTKLKTIKVKNIDQIVKLNVYVSLKINDLVI